MDCGIEPERFWKLSPADIKDIMESYYRKKKKDLKEQAMMFHSLSGMISRNVSALLNKENKPAEVWEFFPGLFADEQESAESAQEESEQAERSEGRRAFSEEFNRRRRERSEP